MSKTFRQNDETCLCAKGINSDRYLKTYIEMDRTYSIRVFPGLILVKRQKAREDHFDEKIKNPSVRKSSPLKWLTTQLVKITVWNLRIEVLFIWNNVLL